MGRKRRPSNPHRQFEIARIINKHKDDPGIDVYKLKPGTKIKVKTERSLYEFEVTDTPGRLLARGGKYISGIEEIHLTGSTYGGSMIRVGWIGQDMLMEYVLPHKRITSSRVVEATVCGPDWEYTVFSLRQ